MLFMVTNRKQEGGKYGNQEKPNNKFDYLYEYDDKPRGEDSFTKSGRSGFEVSFLKELDRLKDEDRVSTPKVGLYIHGFNNDYQDSIDEIYDLEQSLGNAIGYKPVIVGFSWPSNGKTRSYLSDREDVRDSTGAFVRLLLDINELAGKNEKDCFSTTFCIAHSMGNYMLRKGMEHMSDFLGSPSGRMIFSETVMMAPDIAAVDMETNGKGNYISNFSRRVHVYYSKYDRALKASSIKRFGANRLGRHGADDYDALPNNVVVVDAKKYANEDSIAGCLDRLEKQVSVHSSHRYHQDILQDVVHVLSSVDRNQIDTREPVEVDGVLQRNHYKLR